MLWQLKKLSTNEPLNKPDLLPNNWGPIFGLAGIKDKLGDLSWLGEAYSDLGWFEVEGDISDLAVPLSISEQISEAKELLKEEISLSETKINEAPINRVKQQWIIYRRLLQKQLNSTNLPDINWPLRPE